MGGLPTLSFVIETFAGLILSLCVLSLPIWA